MNNNFIALYTGWGINPLMRNLGDFLCLKAAEHLLVKAGIGPLFDVRPSSEILRKPWSGDLIIGGGTVLPSVFIKAPGLVVAKRKIIFGSGVLSPEEVKVRRFFDFDKSVYQEIEVVGLRGPLSVRHYHTFFKKEVPCIGDLVFAFAHSAPVAQRNNEIIFFIIENSLKEHRVYSSLDEMLWLFRRVASQTRFTGFKTVLCLTRDLSADTTLPFNNFFDEVRLISSPKEYVSAVESSQFIITERLHPAILAVNAGIQFLALETTPKISDLKELLMAESLNANQAISSCFVDFKKPLSVNEMLKAHSSVSSNKELPSSLLQTANIIKEKLEGAAKKVADLLKKD